MLQEHVGEAAAIRCAVITVSDTRTSQTDAAGPWIVKRLLAANHVPVHQEIVPDDPIRVRGCVLGLCDGSTCDAIILTGGTGVAPRDTTYEAITAIYEKRIDGFGELFRQLSFGQIGARAMLSRASAGVRRNVAIFSLPGAMGAVESGMDQLVVPVLGHLVALLRGQ